MNRKIRLLLLFYITILAVVFAQDNTTNQTSAESNSSSTQAAVVAPEPASGYLCQNAEDSIQGDVALIPIENQNGISFAASKGDAKEAVDSKSFQVNIYDSSRKLLGSLNTDTHKQNIVSLVQLGTSEKLLSCARDRTLELWSLKENTRLKNVKLEWIEQVVACYHQEAKKSVLIVTIGGLLHEVSEETWEVTKNYTSLNESVIVNSAEFIADSNHVLLGTISNGLYIYSLDSDKVEVNVKLNPESTESRIEAVEALPGSGKVVVANQNPKLYIVSVVNNSNGTIFKTIDLGEKALVKTNGIHASQKTDSLVVVESQAINVLSPISALLEAADINNQTANETQPARFLLETIKKNSRRSHRNTIKFVDTAAANSTQANSSNASSDANGTASNASETNSTQQNSTEGNLSSNASGEGANVTAPEPEKPKPLVPENWTDANPSKEVKAPKKNYKFTYFTSEGSLPRGPAVWKNHELIILGNQGSLIFDFSYDSLVETKGKCLVPCLLDQFGNDTEKTCKKCHHKCKSCSGASEFECLSCNFDDFLFHTSCSSGCIDGTKADIAKKTCTCIEPKVFRRGRCVVDQSGGKSVISEEDKSKKTGIIVAVILIGFIFVAIIVGLCWKFCEPPKKE